MPDEVIQLEQQILELQNRLSEARQRTPNESVVNYTFVGPGDSSISLSDLFEDKKDLIVVHNMGKSCTYCTLWADGFNGVLPNVESRAAFVVISPDDPEAQRKFAMSRGWKFRMVSCRNN